MTVRSTPVWREALTLLNIRFVLAQLGVAVGVLGSFLVWVRLPDASVPEVAGSFLLALLVVAAAGIGECWKFGKARSRHARIICRDRPLVCMERMARASRYA